MKAIDFIRAFPNEISKLNAYFFGLSSEKPTTEKIDFLIKGITEAVQLMNLCTTEEDLMDLLREDRGDLRFFRFVVLVETGKFNQLSREQLDTLLSHVGWRDDVGLSLSRLLTIYPGDMN